MTRYLGQRDNHNCAAVMIINLLKWAGHSATNKDLELIKKDLKTTKEGTEDEDTDKYIRLIKGIKVGKYRYIKDINTLKIALLKDKAVIISYFFNQQEKNIYNGQGHIFLCIGYEKHNFIVTNMSNYLDQTVSYLPVYSMNSILQRKGTKVWIIKREKDAKPSIKKRNRH